MRFSTLPEICKAYRNRNIENIKYFIKSHTASLENCFSSKLSSANLLYSPKPVTKNLASTVRQLELRYFGVEIAEAYSEPCQISKIGLFAKIINERLSVTIFPEGSVLDVNRALKLPLNSVTASQEPVSSNNFFLSQL